MAPSELIFITGATGFIGSHVVNHAIQAGYRVRLSIRRKEQKGDIQRWIDGPEGNVEFVHIPDLTKSGAFKEPLKGVDYVFHLASPLPGKGEDVRKEYVDPAVQGTMGILEEAKNHRQIRLVVITSSIMALLPLGAIRRPPVHPKANTSERLKVDLSRKFPDGWAGHGMKYAASKILAHQATQDFIAREKPAFKQVSFHPTFVIGDSLIQRRFQDIDGMNKQFWNSLDEKEPLIPSAFVHVRDVARAHINALRNLEVLKTGTEFILSTQPFGWDNAAKVVRDEYPQIGVSLKEGPFGMDDWTVDTNLASQDLEMEWSSGEKMVKDLVDQQLSLQSKANL